MQTLPSHVRFGWAPNVKKEMGDTDSIDFSGDKNTAIFYSNGVGKMGTIYLTNSKNESVKITVNITGRVKKYLWNGNDWK